MDIQACLVLLHFAILQFTDIVVCCLCFFFFSFLQIEWLWHPCFEQACQGHFYKNICSLHVCVAYWHCFGLLHHYYIFYGSLSSVIFGVIVMVWGLHETAHIRWQISSTNVVCSNCPPTGRSLISFPLHRLPCSLSHNMKLGQLITLQWPQSVQVKNKSHASLTLNFKND